MLSTLSSKLKSLWSVIWADAKDTWSKIKIYVFAIAALILTLEFRKLKEFLLAYNGKKEMAADNKEDAQLKTKEDSANAQADALVKQSEALPSTEQPVTDNWYEKDKK